MRAFADALELIPTALADNSGLNPIDALAQSKSLQLETNDPVHGIDCNTVGTTNMKEQKVYETYLSKK